MKDERTNDLLPSGLKLLSRMVHALNNFLLLRGVVLKCTPLLVRP
jgi:hypothetical protein